MALSRGTSCSIFVGNLPYDAQEDELRELFSRVGNVTSVRVVSDRDTKQPRGYAFCDFSDSNSVQLAIDRLNNVEYNGRKLRIDWAERELHAPLASRGSGRDLDDGPGGGGGGPPPRGGGPRGGLPDPVPLAPVPTMADRLARLRDEEAAQKARVAAAENAERAEIGRLMETLTPQQVISILGEMQRLTLRAPEVARALLSENMQLALALQHAEFLAGMTEESPLSTEPEVRERARNVREKLWGSAQAPAPPHPSTVGGLPPGAGLQPGMPMHPQAGMMAMTGVPPPPVTMAVMPFGAPAPGFPTAMPFPTAAPTVVGPPPPTAPAPAGTAAVAAVLRQGSPGGAGASLPDVLGAAAADDQSRQSLMERLVQLSPAEIDQLPHEHKVQLLDFLQKLPPRS